MQRSSQLRTATQTRRSARAGGFPEPDDFEGLPVRQWRQEWVSVAPSTQHETTQQGDRWAVELPYGMPRESHLLPPHTQELLRAARSGRLYKRPAPAEEEDQDPEVDIVKGEKKDWEPPSDGYTVKVWKQVPRNVESQTTSHLAKRHKNTVTLASRAVAPPQISGPTVTRATVRRIDAAGNPYEQTVTLNDGQQVDGEIISTTIVPAPVAAQGAAPLQQAPPIRRRPPPPKRKAKGAGRGRKKGKLPLPVPATRSQATTADGEPSVKPESVGPDGIKIEDTEDSANQDSEMADISGMPSEDEEGDGGEGEEEEEGEEDAGDEEGGETPNIEEPNADIRPQEAEDSRPKEGEDSEMAEAIQPSSVEEPDELRPVPGDVEEVTIPKARVQPPGLGNLGTQHAMHLGSRIEGSPLKNVMVLSPTEPSPMISPQAANTSFSTPNYLDVQSRTMSMDAVHQAYATETTTPQGILPPLRDHRAPTQATSHNAAPTPQPAQAQAPRPAPAEEASTEAPKPAEQEPKPAPPSIPAAPTENETDTLKPPPAETETAPTTQQQPEPTATTTTTTTTELTTETAPETAPDLSLQPPDSPALLPTVVTQNEDDDDGLNLLGSLERELDRQEGVSSASASSGGGEGGEEGRVTPNPDVAAAVAAVLEEGTTTTTVAAETAGVEEEKGAEGTTTTAAAAAEMETGKGAEMASGEGPSSSSVDAETVVKDEGEREGSAAAPAGSSS